MNLKSTIVFSIALFVAAFYTTATAKNTPNTKIKSDSENIVVNYVDSLKAYTAKMASDDAKDNNSVATSDFYRLFGPVTFYHSPASNELSIQDDDDETKSTVDAALLNLYLNRPDLINVTQTEIDKAGTIRNDVEEKPKTEVKLADKVAPMPVAPTNNDAPAGVVITKPNFWKFSAKTSYQLQQYYYSDNWHKGGESNYTMYADVRLKANYNNKQKIKFDNELVMQLGFRNTREDTLHKFKTNTDVLRYTGKLGLQASKKWYYSLELIAYTQFTKGLKSNDSKVYSDFMSPFTLNLSVGMDYSVATKNNRLKGSINLSPLAFNFKYVDRKNLAERYGIKGGHRTAEDFGSKINANLDWQITDIVSWNTRLYGFTSYKRALVEWENKFTLKISKYISANLVVYPRFDDSTKRDDDMGYLQFYEYSSIGFDYSF